MAPLYPFGAGAAALVVGQLWRVDWLPVSLGVFHIGRTGFCGWEAAGAILLAAAGSLGMLAVLRAMRTASVEGG